MGPDFPSQDLDEVFSKNNQAELVSDGVSQMVNRNKNSFLRAPFYSAEEITADDSNDEFEGEMNFRALRENVPSSYWDVEPGDKLRVELLERNFVEDISFEGVIQLVDRQNRSHAWFYEDDYIFGNGAVMVTEGFENMPDMKYEFYIKGVEKRNHYRNFDEKLRSVFENPSPEVRSALRVLNMDYEEFSNGRML